MHNNTEHTPDGFQMSEEELIQDFATDPVQKADAPAYEMPSEEEIKYTTEHQPDFEKPFSADEGKEEPQPKEHKPLTAEMTSVSLDVALAFVDMIQAELLMRYAKSTNKEKYQLSEEEKEMLVKTWQPIIKANDNKIDPKWIAYAVTVWIFGVKVMEARNDRMTAIKLEKNKGKLSQAARQAIAQTEAAAGERQNYEIHASGAYRYDMTGKNYINADKATAKPDIANAEVLQKVIEKNGWQKVRRAFDLPEDYLQGKNIHAKTA